jgi:hypothetical protein
VSWPESGLTTWGEFTDDADLLTVPLDGSAGTPDPQPLYLVCTHSKRDVCCALRGRPYLAALEQLRPGRVWECSHTGGHRFAPNVLALPLGALYGRLPDGSAAELVAATEAGNVLASQLRGRIGLSPVEQAADGYLRQQLYLAGVGDVTVVGVEPVGDATASDGEWIVHLAAGARSYSVTLIVEQVELALTSCGKPGTKREVRVRPLRLSRG